MIQRIQSVYFLLAIIAAALMFVFPLAEFFGDSNFILYVYKLDFFDPNPSLELSPYFLLPLMGGVIMIAFLSLWALLSFKNRKRQLLITKIGMGFSLLLLAGYFFGYALMLERAVDNPPHYELASFMPALIFLFLLLANKGVQKDEKLIKSMDRLR
ncbi:MAG: hypothetical protein B7C24_04935 [Bacteroidetes bacterium 4572_77]|nr:MAG: hypothetical protein B7C24_04935 [Bacteroidetes bacterium 4572_77]